MRRVRYSVFMSNRDGSHDKIILDQFTRQREGIRWLSTTTKSIEEIATTIMQEVKLERRVF